MGIRIIIAIAAASILLPLCPGQIQAPPITVDNRPELGLEIVSLQAGRLASTEIADLKCIVKNSGTKPVEAFVAVWLVTRASGTVQVFNHIWDNSLAKGMSKLLPRDSVTITSGKYTCPPTNPFRQVTAQIDYVRYADGTSAGPNIAKMALVLQDRKATAAFLRSYLLTVYREHGLEALLEELRTSY